MNPDLMVPMVCQSISVEVLKSIKSGDPDTALNDLNKLVTCANYGKERCAFACDTLCNRLLKRISG